MYKKILIMQIIIIIIISYTSCFSARVYAASKERLEVMTYNIPDDAAYIDIFILMSTDDEMYTEYNKANIERYSFNIKPLVSFNEEGYVSLSCHYKNNYTEMDLNRINSNEGNFSKNDFILKMNDYGGFDYGRNLMEPLYLNKYKMKVGILDRDGNIIKMSPEFDIINQTGYLEYNIRYDANNNTVHLDWNYYRNEPRHHKLIFTIIILFVFGILILCVRILTKIYRWLKNLK